MTSGWTTSADLQAKVRRRWADGSLLRSLATGESFTPVDLPIRGPRAGDIGQDLDAVRQWIQELEVGGLAGRRFELVHTAIGGRHFGRNQLPSRALITSYEQAWRLLGVDRQVTIFRRMLELSRDVPAARAWVAQHPLRAIEVADRWPALLAAYLWLDAARGSGRYLREITAPGVDTKLVERHRGVLAQLLAVEGTTAGFLAGLGLRSKPELLRLRFGPGALGFPPPLTEATLRVEELAELPGRVRTAVVVENETTYLTVPVPEQGVVFWGKGFEVSRVGALPWLGDVDVHYWGDLDTHGFAILNQLRAWLPHATSFLMDHQTLAEHRDRWVREPTPTAAGLSRLTDTEAEVYADLVSDRFGDAVRLEQECIDWSWVQGRLPYARALPPQP